MELGRTLTASGVARRYTEGSLWLDWIYNIAIRFILLGRVQMGYRKIIGSFYFISMQSNYIVYSNCHRGQEHASATISSCLTFNLVFDMQNSFPMFSFSPQPILVTPKPEVRAPKHHNDIPTSSTNPQSSWDDSPIVNGPFLTMIVRTS